jgi:uncharacterized protein YkwD
MKLQPGQRIDAKWGMALVGAGFVAFVLFFLWLLTGCTDDASPPTPDVVYVYVCPSPTPKIVPPPLPTREATGIVPPAPVPSAVSTVLPPVVTREPTAVPPNPPVPVPTGVVTRQVPRAGLASGVGPLHDGPVPLFTAYGPERRPCWARSSRVTCTPTPVAPPPTAEPTSMPTAEPTAAPTNTAGTTATPTPEVCGQNRWLCATVAEMETELHRIVNQHRVSIGRIPLGRVTSLDLAQREWADRMVAENACYHGDFGERAARYGYTGFAWGEAGACGQDSPQQTLDDWLDSPGHRGIVEADQSFGVTFTDIGVGCAQYGTRHWTCWILVAGH